MSEEKKYSVVGKVEIGTDEYRDLIEGLAAARSRAEEKESRYYDEYRRANKAEEETKKALSEVEQYKAFISSSEQVQGQYMAWLFALKNKKEG